MVKSFLVWLGYYMLNLPCMILSYLIGFIVVLFCDIHGELPWCLRYFQTWDDSCNPRDVCDYKQIPGIFLYDWHKHYEQTIGTTPELEKLNRTRYFSPCIDPNFTLKEKLQRYVCRVYWLIRNCGYGWAFWLFGKDFTNKDEIKVLVDKPNFQILVDETNNAFTYKDSREIFTIFNRRLELNVYFGWKFGKDDLNEKPKRCMLATRFISFKIVNLNEEKE